MVEPWEQFMDKDTTWMLLSKRQKVERLLTNLRKLLGVSEDDFTSVRLLTLDLVGPEVPLELPRPYGEAMTDPPQPNQRGRDTDIMGDLPYRPRQYGEAYQEPAPRELRNRDDDIKGDK